MSTTKIDYLANIAIASCTVIVILVYSSIVLIPAWDDGTGFQVFRNSMHFSGPTPQRVKFVRDELIPSSVRLWAANLSVEISSSIKNTKDQKENSNSNSDEYTIDLFDSRAELGMHNVMRLKFCKRQEKSSIKFCICDKESIEKIASDLWIDEACVPVDERQQHERGIISPDRRQIAIMLRQLAQVRVEKVENEAFDRLVLRLRYYYQTSAGVDAMFKAMFHHSMVEVEEAPISVRHSLSLVQPRLPPKRDKQMKLNFIVVEKDSRWIHDLAKDPQANALTHAPFVFPMCLIFLACVFRVVKGVLAELKGLIDGRRKKNVVDKEEGTKQKVE